MRMLNRLSAVRSTWAKAVVTIGLSFALFLPQGCGGAGFLGLQDYQRDLIFGGLAAALLANQQADTAALNRSRRR